MRFTMLALPLILLGCAPGGPFCAVPGSRDLSVINGLVRETQANLTRGYALEERDEIRTRRTFCTGRNDDGSTFRFRCEETDTISVDVPVAINLEEEQAKLNSLLTRQSALQQQVNEGRAACAAYDAQQAALTNQ